MKLNDYKLWTALITPLKPSYQVDYPSLEKLLDEQTKAGNALLILGSTGEALNLSLETRKEIVEYVLAKKPSTPIMVGVGGHDIAAQKDWTKWLETKEIQAYLMVSPIYAKPNDEGQYLWFKELMDGVTRPVMLYNVPGRTGSWLSFKAVSKLKDHKNFWAIKEAGGSVAKFKEYLAASGNAPVYCGDDGLLGDFARAGSTGLVSVAANTWPHQTNLYTKKCLDNSMGEAQSMWTESCDSLFVVSNPIPAKALLANEGRISHNTMMPPLYAGDFNHTAQVMKSSQNINNWYKKNS